jgi:hypothetical protein
MVLVDYKGGATFAPFEDLPHVAGVITNLEDDAGLIERVYSSLAGEVQRRQQVLKDAGNIANIGDYTYRRQHDPGMPPLPPRRTGPSDPDRPDRGAGGRTRGHHEGGPLTHDVVALVRQAPTVRTMIDSMVHTGENLRVRGAAEGAVIQLCDDEGRTLVSIEAPQHVRVEGEVERLLGAETAALAPAPIWWVEARASGTDARSAALGRRFAEELVRRLGGTVWTGWPEEQEQ